MRLLNRTTWLCLAAGLLACRMAAAQTFLDQLEKQLEKVVPPRNQADAENDEPGYLGLVADDTNEMGRGVRVLTVHALTPAEAAGLRAEDLIVAIDGRAVTRLADMATVLDRTPAGRKLDFKVERAGKSQTVPVTLGKRPVPFQRPPAEPDPSASAPREADRPAFDVRSGRPSLGVTVVAVTDELRQRYGLGLQRGALISGVRPGSPAAESGLTVGKLIVAVDGQRVDTPQDLVAQIGAARTDQEVEVTYYEGVRLARKKVKLTAAADPTDPDPTDPDPLAAQGGGRLEPPLRLGDPQGRPVLDKVERLLDNIVSPDVPRARPQDAPDVATLQRQVQSMQAQIDQLQRRVQELESRLATKEKPSPELKLPKK